MSPPRARFDLVIFDNDGVLVDSEPHANRILSEILVAAGCPMTREKCVAEFIGTSLATVRQTVEARFGAALPPHFEHSYHDRLFAIFATELTAIPGVTEALAGIELPTCVGRAARTSESGSHSR